MSVSACMSMLSRFLCGEVAIVVGVYLHSCEVDSVDCLLIVQGSVIIFLCLVGFLVVIGGCSWWVLTVSWYQGERLFVLQLKFSVL